MSISNRLISFDFDGVFSTGNFHPEEDALNIILTGRCTEEYNYVNSKIKDLGFDLPIYLNPISLKKRGNHSYHSRTSAALFKAKTLNLFFENGFDNITHYEDDPLQILIIRELVDSSIFISEVINEEPAKY